MVWPSEHLQRSSYEGTGRDRSGDCAACKGWKIKVLEDGQLNGAAAG